MLVRFHVAHSPPQTLHSGRNAIVPGRRLLEPAGMTPRTLNDIFFRVADRSRYPVMLHRQAIDWVPIMPPEFSRKILAISSALMEWGVAKGDRVAILSEN